MRLYRTKPGRGGVPDSFTRFHPHPQVRACSRTTATVSTVRFDVGTEAGCRDESAGRVVAVSVESALTLGHLLSAGLVGFARGLNDTPKIVGLLVGIGTVSTMQGTIAVALMMAIGGLLARPPRRGDPLQQDHPPITPSQGLVGNLATSALVVGASRFGLPVSTNPCICGRHLRNPAAARGGWIAAPSARSLQPGS